MADIINPQGHGISSIGLGTKVTMRGDLGSPIMTTIMPIIPQNSAEIHGWVCGWFNVSYTVIGNDGGPNLDQPVYSSTHLWNTIQLPLELLQRAEEPQ